MARVSSLPVDLKRAALSMWPWPYHINPLNPGPEISGKLGNLKHQRIPCGIAGLRTDGSTWQGMWMASRIWVDPPTGDSKQKKEEVLESYNCKEWNSTNGKNELGYEFFPSLQMRSQTGQYLNFSLMVPWAENLVMLRRNADLLWLNEWVLF